MSQSRCLGLIEKANTRRCELCERVSACWRFDQIVTARTVTFHSVTFSSREMIQTPWASRETQAARKPKNGRLCCQRRLIKASCGFQVGSSSWGQTLSEVQKQNLVGSLFEACECALRQQDRMKGNGFRTLRHDLYSRSFIDFLCVCWCACKYACMHIQGWKENSWD